MKDDVGARYERGQGIALPRLQAAERHRRQGDGGNVVAMLEAHEARSMDDGRIVSGHAHQFDLEHAPTIPVDALELVTAHLRHHRRYPSLAEPLAVDEGVDELAVHPQQRRATVIRAAAGGRRSGQGHDARQKHPPFPAHRALPEQDDRQPSAAATRGDARSRGGFATGQLHGRRKAATRPASNGQSSSAPVSLRCSTGTRIP